MELGEPGLIKSLENGFTVLQSVLLFLPEEVQTILIAAVALTVLLGLFHLLSR